MNILTMERHLEMMMVMVTTAPCTERENEVRDDIIWPQFLVHSPLMVRGALQSSCRECNVCWCSFSTLNLGWSAKFYAQTTIIMKPLLARFIFIEKNKVW